MSSRLPGFDYFIGICYLTFLPREKGELGSASRRAGAESLPLQHPRVSVDVTFPMDGLAAEAALLGYHAAQPGVPVLPSGMLTSCLYPSTCDSPGEIWEKGGGAVNQTFCPRRFQLTICLQCFCQ